MLYDEIKYVGLNDLNQIEQDSVHKLASEYFPKMKRGTSDLVSMKVHIKTHNEQGTRKTHSIHVQITTPNHKFTSTKAVDWDISRTMHKACKDCEAQIKHRLHNDEQHPIGSIHKACMQGKI